ncbi:MAG: NotI family restriction endonuclease [Burkholderiales bacterium]
MSKTLEPKLKASRYGIGEWFGHPIASISAEDRKNFAKAAINSKIKKNCPFRGVEKSQMLCNKKGGVCSLVTYTQDAAGNVAVGKADHLVTTCPSRFWAGNDLFKVIGREMLQCDAPIIVKEVGFLASVDGKSDRDVGRIDTVLVSNRNGLADWCAIEIQAVYFSGNSMGPEFVKLRARNKMTLVH